MPWAAAGAVAGAFISSSGAKSAAGKQSDAAREASQLEAEAAAQMREDLQPWVTAGGAAQNKLATYLGTGMGTTGTVNGMQSGLTRDQLREQLLKQYTRTVAPAAAAPAAASSFQDNWLPPGRIVGGQSNGQYGGDGDSTGVPGWYDNRTSAPAATTEVDEAGLNAAIEKYYADQSAQEAKMASDPNYGSLLKSYKDGADFKFDATDLQNEAGYQFGLDQGMLGLDRAQASRGNFLSGAAVKQATRYAQDYAGTKADAAYGRQLGTWNTNKAGFDSNRNSIYSFLTGQSTMGQNSAARVGTNNQQVATSIGNNIQSAGNAASAASVVGSNSLASAFNKVGNSTGLNSAGSWNTLLANNNIGRSGNNYNGSSWLPEAANYENSMDRGL